MEEPAVGAGSDIVDDGWLQIDKDGTRNVLGGSCLAEESVEYIMRDFKESVTGSYRNQIEELMNCKVELELKPY